jgi:hypothetical protein
MNKNKTGLRSYRMKITYEDLLEEVKKHFPPNVTIPPPRRNSINSGLPPALASGFGPIIHKIQR